MEERAVGEVVGSNVLALRKRQLLSREDLAELSGLSAKGIDWLERGQSKRPRRPTVEALAGALGVTVEDLTSEEPISPKAAAPPSKPEARREPVYISAASGAGGGSAAELHISVEELRRLLAATFEGEITPQEALDEALASAG